MTIIVTHMDRHGIVHASDSNLTSQKSSQAIEGKKVFEIKYLNAGLTVAGAYGVGKTRMDVWMQRFIQEQKKISDLNLGDFANLLKDALQQQMHPSQKSQGSLIHIAGYVEDNGVSHPEFWLVTNVPGFDTITGEYFEPSDEFHASEDFWNRDCPKKDLLRKFQQGGYQYYVNGFTSGRVSYNLLRGVMNQFLEVIWSNPNWKFRPPCSIEETAILVETYIQFVGAMFQLSDYSAPFIGGKPRTLLIKSPSNAVTRLKDM